MVLGLRSKNKKGASVHVDYIINIQVIKPWPPSQSLRSIRCVVLQWENGDRKSGFTNPVVPSLGSGIGDGKIEFNEPFKLQVTFLKEAPMKGNDPGTFQKNLLELNLYEPRRDKTLKGQHLGSAVIDLAEHGVIKEAVSVGVPVNCKRSFRNTAQPVLYVKIQPNNRDSASSSSRESLSKEVSLDKDGRESVSALMNEEYAEEAEFASLTDDDGSSYSSLTNSSSAFEANADLQSQNSPREPLDRENISESRKESKGVSNVETDLHLESVPVKSEVKPATEAYVPNGAAIHQNGSPCQSSSLDLSIGPGSLDDGDASVSNSPQREFTLNMEKLDKPSTNSVSASVTYKGMEDEIRSSKNMDGVERDDLFQEVHAKVVDCRGAETIVGDPLKKENYINGSVETFESSEVVLQKEKLNLLSTTKPEHNVDEDGMSRDNKNGSMDLASSNGVHEIFMEKKCEEQIINGSDGKIEELQNHSLVIERLMDSRDNLTMASVASVDHIPVNQQHRILQSDLREPVTADRPVPSQRVLGEKGNSTLFRDRPHSMKFSFGLPPDSMGNMTLVTNNQIVEDVKEIDFLEDVRNSGVNFVTDEGIDDQETTSSSSDKVKHVSRDKRKGFSYNKVRELELRVHMLEGELREAAAIEIGLYSVVAEHGSSMHKVHTPARRLSRLYIHASKQWSQERRGSTARSAVSGLILAAKACGNDVPRLTFWLTNLVVLRAIVTQAARHSDTEANGAGMAAKRKTSPLKWKSTLTKKIKFPFTEELDDWEDPHTFTAALEKIESWTFSRIIESIWWQTFTPHMQSTNEDDDEPKKSLHSKKSNGRKPSLDAQEQANISIKIWKKALKDACERLCPVRAGGHDCGCLPMLARLVMEQCVARLDVAMFNAILRESDDEIPTDPVSDPIGDSRVLPVPSGKSSFGAGAQLKNAIGNWSRWLTDLFGIDADDSAQDENEQDDDRLDVAASFKSFHLLNALSDLLMLPKDMLLESSIRKEVCPAFSALMIKRILNSFEPDEFYPDPIPDRVLEALDSEDPLEKSEEKIRNLPCNASPIVYSPPSMASIENIVGDIRNRSLLRSGSSVLRKCHTSDDELDELDSPLASIFIDRSPTPTAKSKGISIENTVRYQLLREVWRDGD